MDTKQVIVWRHDLKVRKGKIAAQVAHASMAAFINKGHLIQAEGSKTKSLCIPLDEAMEDWITEKFKKVCVYCENEGELMELFAKAKKAGLPVALITDSGCTEFKGVPTRTCIGIGPAKAEEVDKITGHLPLL